MTEIPQKKKRKMEGHPAVVSRKEKKSTNLKLNRILRCTFGLVSRIMETTQSHDVESVGTKLCCL